MWRANYDSDDEDNALMASGRGVRPGHDPNLGFAGLYKYDDFEGDQQYWGKVGHRTGQPSGIQMLHSRDTEHRREGLKSSKPTPFDAKIASRPGSAMKAQTGVVVRGTRENHADATAVSFALEKQAIGRVPQSQRSFQGTGGNDPRRIENRWTDQGDKKQHGRMFDMQGFEADFSGMSLSHEGTVSVHNRPEQFSGYGNPQNYTPDVDSRYDYEHDQRGMTVPKVKGKKLQVGTSSEYHTAHGTLSTDREDKEWAMLSRTDFADQQAMLTERVLASRMQARAGVEHVCPFVDDNGYTCGRVVNGKRMYCEQHSDLARGQHAAHSRRELR